MPIVIITPAKIMRKEDNEIWITISSYASC